MTTDKATLGAQPFLRGMTDDHLAKLAALCEHVAVPARQRLFDEGATADRFWLIDAGQVRSTRPCRAGAGSSSRHWAAVT
jgi:CRP/FNR family transcriptional regulator, cyclic AMP receptor protein